MRQLEVPPFWINERSIGVLLRMCLVLECIARHQFAAMGKIITGEHDMLDEFEIRAALGPMNFEIRCEKLLIIGKPSLFAKFPQVVDDFIVACRVHVLIKERMQCRLEVIECCCTSHLECSIGQVPFFLIGVSVCILRNPSIDVRLLFILDLPLRLSKADSAFRIEESNEFESFLKKVSGILNGIDFDFINNSSDEVDLTITVSLKEDKDLWIEVRDQIEKASKIIVHESIVFVRNKTVIEYERLEDYLLDFKDEIERTKLFHLDWTVSKETSELAYLKAKLEYLKFMVAKKRTDDEIDQFLTKFEKPITSRLDSIKLRQLSNEEVERTIELIKIQEQKLKDFIKQQKEQDKVVNSMKFELRGKRIKPAEQLFEHESADGIEVFEIEEEPEEETEV